MCPFAPKEGHLEEVENDWMTRSSGRCLVSQLQQTPTQHSPSSLATPIVGARLQHYWHIWSRWGASPQVVTTLREGYSLPFREKPPLTRHPPIISGYQSIEKNLALHQAVQDLLYKHAIVEVHKRKSLGFYSRIFLVPKKTGGWRPVIDLSHLNSFLQVERFKMETPESVRSQLQQGEWVTSLDLKDAYLHVPIHKQHQKYLRFAIGDKIYQFCALPFGLATAPREFTLVTKELRTMEKKVALLLHLYLDDWTSRAISCSKS